MSIDEAGLAKVRALMSGLQVPQHYDKVYKDECVYCFDSPFSPHGLYVNIRSRLAFGEDYVGKDAAKAGPSGALYLLQKWTRIPKEEKADEKEPTKLAIGVTGGFLAEEKWDIVKKHSLVAFDNSGAKVVAVALPCAELPEFVSNVCQGIIQHQGAKSMESVAQWDAASELKESKYAKNLVQLPPTNKISPNPKDWKCMITGATENLWLNLSDGFIGGGRRFWDGSGGSNGALDHYDAEKTKGNEYPLVVKLGTITPHGADVYSYSKDEDDLVKDPFLAEHLAHWGIDVMKMEKTDKTLSEMEVEKNMNYDWSNICESGKDLVRVRGPGLVGLKNLGNSCYFNSAMQLMMSIPEMVVRYADKESTIRLSGDSGDMHTKDLVGQMAKLANAMSTDRYAPPWKEEDDEDDPALLVAPQTFKTLVGKGHHEFSSGRQQDAAEFLQYLLEQLNRAERTALGMRLREGAATGSFFEFDVEERFECNATHRVRYQRMTQNILGMPVKLEDAENLAEVMAAKSDSEGPEAKKPKTEGEGTIEVKPIILPLTCLRRFTAPEDGVSFRGTTVTKATRIATMPKYLLISVNRYFVDEKWMPNKLDSKVPMPDSLDLEPYRGRGIQAGEEELPADEASGGRGESNVAQAPAETLPDEELVAQLLSMGFGENGCRRACVAVQNSSVDAAMNWVLEHMEDQDFNDPMPPPGQAGGGGAGDAQDVCDPEQVMMLTSMGFSEKHVKGALKACGGNVERAADWLFSHVDDLDSAVAALDSSNQNSGAAEGDGGGTKALDDGPGQYNLVGFISHVGKHTSHGHYVCHVKKEKEAGGWVIFDDQKVAKSEDPPKDLGYVYLYRRSDLMET